MNKRAYVIRQKLIKEAARRGIEYKPKAKVPTLAEIVYPAADIDLIEEDNDHSEDKEYWDTWNVLNQYPPIGFELQRSAIYKDGATHLPHHITGECSYVSRRLKKLKPKKILDIGSYTNFLLGLSAYFNIVALDIRPRLEKNYKTIVADSLDIPIRDNNFDAVISMCTIEHLGTTRYGDSLDYEADGKTIKEIIRILKPGGHFIFTTTVTRGLPSYFHNAHKIYSKHMIHKMLDCFVCKNESYFSIELGRFCSFKEVGKGLDIYCGHWSKPLNKSRR